MKTFIVAIVAVLAVSNAFPKPANTIVYQDENGNTITEDLDQPMPAPYAVSISKLDFMLYTRANPKTPCKMILGDVNSVKNCGFNSAAKTIVLVHGWQNNHDAESVQTIKEAYLAHSAVNVLIFGYEEYNAPYLSAVSTAPKVGEGLGEFIKFLANANYVRINAIHIIGHSLGAHISGFAAQHINSGSSNKVARITGLDPAGPLFDNKKADGRLSSDDASFVDIIHSSSSLGLVEVIGTVDFLPNGGNNQPDCTQLISTGCDHQASFRYYAKSISQPNLYSSLKCSSLANAQNKDKAPTTCTPSAAKMGEIADSTASAGIYYVYV